MKHPLHTRELNRAMEYFNPLRGLDIPRVVRLLEQGERGIYHDLQKLNRMAEKRHPTLRALKRRRLAALKKLDWDVKVPDVLPKGITAAQAEAQRVHLRERYEAIVNLPQAFEFLALAEIRGFSHLEPHHQDNNPSLPVVRLQPVPQWHWLRDRENFAWRYDAEAEGNETSAVPIDPTHFIIREVDDPLCEIALLCFIRRNFGKKNWTVFQADYAIPAIFAMLGENTPIDKVKEWLELVKAVTNNARGAVPPGSKVEALDVGDRDGAQFDNFIKAEDADLVLAGTSGLLTMLTADTGMNGDGQSDAHEATFDALAIAEANEISAIFQEQFDKPILAEEFPSQPAVAYFELAAKDQEDVDALADRAVKFASAGFEPDAAELSEKSGMKLTKKAAVTAGDPEDGGRKTEDGGRRSQIADRKPEDEPLKNRAISELRSPNSARSAGRMARFESAAERSLAAADRAVLAPVIERVVPIREKLARIADLDDDAFAAGMAALQPQLAALRRDLPELEAAVLTGRPDLDDAFTDILGTAFLSGAAEAAKPKSDKP